METWKVLTGVFFVLLALSPASVSAQSPDIEVVMEEERVEGSVVVNVSHYPSLFMDVSLDDRSKLTFSILDRASHDASFFTINTTSGVITTARRVDREAIKKCGSQLSCHLDFNVNIRGSQGLSFSNIASTRVYIHDINDNAPDFPEDRVELDISEAARDGTVLQLRGPTDLDSPPNNTIQRYELTLQESVFSVTPKNNPDGSTVLNLVLQQELDRETVSSYDFNIIAYDGGSPPKSDFLRVIVRVTDDNDNAPEFDSPSYTVKIGEDAAPATEVLRVKATDKDAGDFGTVRYRFSSLASDEVKRLFRINASSGSISLQAELDHATGDVPYSLAVEAFDGDDPPLVGQAMVYIHVLNTGNNAPEIRIVTVSDGDTSEISLPESAKVNDFVAFVNVEDRDEGANGEVVCFMVQQEGQFALEALPNKGYQVLLGSPVDREVIPSYQASILCRDQGSPPLSTEVEFTVIITDVNDNDPRFAQNNFAISVPENNAAGQYLIQVAATDNDTSHNALITYAILEPESEAYVSIHAQSGVVRARGSLDREVTPILTFTLLAKDGGEPPRTGTARLTITVLDMNDNSPQLLHLPYRFEVSEGALPGHVIAKMAALDLDEGENGEIITPPV